MKSITLAFVFFLLINLLLTESFENKNNLVSINSEKISNLKQPMVLNDEEDMDSIEKRQNKKRRRRRKNKNNQINNIQAALTLLQSQLASIATQINGLTTTTRRNPNAR